MIIYSNDDAFTSTFTGMGDGSGDGDGYKSACFNEVLAFGFKTSKAGLFIGQRDLSGIGDEQPDLDFEKIF